MQYCQNINYLCEGVVVGPGVEDDEIVIIILSSSMA